VDSGPLPGADIQSLAPALKCGDGAGLWPKHKESSSTNRPAGVGNRATANASSLSTLTPLPAAALHSIAYSSEIHDPLSTACPFADAEPLPRPVSFPPFYTLPTPLQTAHEGRFPPAPQTVAGDRRLLLDWLPVVQRLCRWLWYPLSPLCRHL